MKLYREPVIIGVSFISAIVIIIYASLTIPRQNTNKTVDGNTPIPVLIGNQTMQETRNKLLNNNDFDFERAQKPDVNVSEHLPQAKESKQSIVPKIPTTPKRFEGNKK